MSETYTRFPKFAEICPNFDVLRNFSKSLNINELFLGKGGPTFREIFKKGTLCRKVNLLRKSLKADPPHYGN
jgi:hypothetical protein